MLTRWYGPLMFVSLRENVRLHYYLILLCYMASDLLTPCNTKKWGTNVIEYFLGGLQTVGLDSSISG